MPCCCLESAGSHPVSTLGLHWRDSTLGFVHRADGETFFSAGLKRKL